jgi:hypothetical protein
VIDSARIRRELEALLADQTQAVRDLAQTVADRASAAIAAGQPPSEVIARAVEGYDQALQDRISRDVTKAVCMGAGIWPEVATTGFTDQFAAQALVMSWDASQMPLSTRIHGTSVAMRAELDSAIRASISRRDGAWKQARRIYDGYGFGGIIHQDQLPGLPKDLDALVRASRATLTPEGLADLQARAKALKKYAAGLRTAPLRAAYTQLLGNLEKGLSRGLERAIKTAAEEKARYHAERISRTETARAWGQGFMDQLDRDEDATGLRWETSSAHKIFDICDFHSRADLYGMGPGVYPLDRRPRFPAHPHCLCVLSAVYRGKPRFDQVDKGGKAALDGMTSGQRARVLTIKGAEGFDRGGSWKGSLRHWEEPGLSRPSQGARVVLDSAQLVRSGPYQERPVSSLLARVRGILEGADAKVASGKWTAEKARVESQRLLEKTIRVQHPASISTKGAKLKASQVEGRDRLASILSRKAVPDGIDVTVEQIGKNSASNYSSFRALAYRKSLGGSAPPGWVPGHIKMRDGAPPEIMAHELTHAADDQNPKLFDAIEKRRFPVADSAYGGYGNKVYAYGGTEFLTQGVTNLLSRGPEFFRTEPTYFEVTLKLLRGED